MADSSSLKSNAERVKNYKYKENNPEATKRNKLRYFVKVSDKTIKWQGL